MLSTFSATSWAILAIDRRIRSASIRTLPLSVISPPTAFYSNRLLPQLTHDMCPIHPNSNRVARSPPARLSFSPVCPPGPPVCSHLHAAQHAKPAPCLFPKPGTPHGLSTWESSLAVDSVTTSLKVTSYAAAPFAGGTSPGIRCTPPNPRSRRPERLTIPKLLALSSGDTQRSSLQNTSRHSQGISSSYSGVARSL